MTEGERARHSSWVALLAGVPASAMAWQLWSHVVLGPGPRVQALRYDGWQAVAVMLPATLLVLGMAVASVALAAKACTVHVHGARTAFWASAAGLFVVLAVLATTTADDVQNGASSTLEWVLRGVALVVAGVVALGLRWWAREAGG